MPGIRFQCPQCGQHLEAPEEAAGLPLPCPACQHPLQVPSPAAPPACAPAVGIPLPPSPSSRGPICSICLSPIEETDAKQACPECHTEYHADCWTENGGCGVYGCVQAPAVELRHSIEIPVSYWGQEKKPCPNCRQEILAAAVRCRHCGATFASARPEETDEFYQRTALEQRLPRLRKTVIWLFVVCALPCLAPVGAVWGWIWYASHRRDLAAMPSLYPALCKIALAVAAGQTILIILMALLYAAVRGS